MFDRSLRVAHRAFYSVRGFRSFREVCPGAVLLELAFRSEAGVRLRWKGSPGERIGVAE